VFAVTVDGLDEFSAGADCGRITTDDSTVP
jgi:hypothetical protein